MHHPGMTEDRNQKTSRTSRARELPSFCISLLPGGGTWSASHPGASIPDVRCWSVSANALGHIQLLRSETVQKMTRQVPGAGI